MTSRLDPNVIEMKKKLTQLEKRIVLLEHEMGELRGMLDPDKKHRLLAQLDSIEKEIEEEVGAHSKEVEKEAKKWLDEEKHFLGLDSEGDGTGGEKNIPKDGKDGQKKGMDEQGKGEPKK